MYKKDFEEERNDRARIAGKLEALERESTKDAEKIQNLEVQLKQAADEIQAKFTEIKNYRQLVERLQKDLREAKQQNQRMEPLVTLQHEEKVCSSLCYTISFVFFVYCLASKQVLKIVTQAK